MLYIIIGGQVKRQVPSWVEMKKKGSDLSSMKRSIQWMESDQESAFFSSFLLSLSTSKATFQASKRHQRASQPANELHRRVIYHQPILLLLLRLLIIYTTANDIPTTLPVCASNEPVINCFLYMCMSCCCCWPMVSDTRYESCRYDRISPHWFIFFLYFYILN